MLPVYVVNLDRRPDRWAFMSEQFDRFGIEATRIPAIDAQSLHASEQWGKIWHYSLGGQAGILSLTKALIELLGSGAPAALMLEDDVELAADTPTLLEGMDWWPAGAHIVRLYCSQSQPRLLWEPSGRTPTGRMLRRLEQHAPGACAFLIDQRGARIALSAFSNPHAGTDTMLFNQVRSEAARKFGTVQIVPAMARHPNAFPSDQAGWGKKWRAERPRRRLEMLSVRRLGKWHYLLRVAALRIRGKVSNQHIPYSVVPYA